MAKPAPSRLDNVIALAKRRGFVFPVWGNLMAEPDRRRITAPLA